MPNRLADATSPYLQQHKDNPVAWWPWCDAAFEEAKARDVPVFLSIGYATCHWCHVMAHESFEDEAVARAMNDAFVCIKVDREERPDVDDVYMDVCQAMTGRGGWPLNVVLTPDKKPWFAATYVPKASRGHHIGMLDLVPGLSKAWRERRDEIDAQAAHLVDHLNRPPAVAGSMPDSELLGRALQGLAGRFDGTYGGFGGAPKFPSLHQVRFLLRMHLGGAPQALAMAKATLDGMARGGIRDHVAGGFHRYSTDAAWHLPHFEKMLYDQGMALLAFAEAHMIAPEPGYEEVLRDTATYLHNEMRHESGAFFAAEDADSEGEEGIFTTWPWEELVQVVDEALARALGASPEGNYHDEATRQPVARNILFLTPKVTEDLHGQWRRVRPDLLARRDLRPRPLRDEKVLTDWNGIAIAGLAAAGRALADDGLIARAEEALLGLLGLHGASLDDLGPLRHAWCRNEASERLFVDDLAAVALAAGHVAMATHRAEYAELANEAMARCAEYAAPEGRYYRSLDDDGMPSRPMPIHDGALPSANAQLAEADVIVSRGLTGQEPAVAQQILEAFGGSLSQHPMAFTGLLSVACDLLQPYAEVVVYDPAGLQESRFTQALSTFSHPHVYALWTDGSGLGRSGSRAYLRPEWTGPAKAFLCRDGACELPIVDPDQVVPRLRAVLG